MNEQHTKIVLQPLDGLFNAHSTTDTDTKPVLKIGGHYNWKYAPERLVYLGNNWSGNGYWHQFAKVESPDVVWCEVLDSELHLIEEAVAVADVLGTPGRDAVEVVKLRDLREYTDLARVNTHDPTQDIFEISPTHVRQVGTIAHIPSRRQGKTAQLNAYAALIAGYARRVL